MLKLYYGRRPAAETDKLIALLPPWRQENLSRLRNESARLSSLGAGLLWRRVMEQNGVDFMQPVRRLGAGKPVFASGGVWFSLSHSGALCLCALADAPVGADVQETRAVKLSVARRFCPGERAYLEALPNALQNGALMALWARKEAWVKAVSEERMVALDEYDVLTGADWMFSDFRIEGCYAAVCGRETAERPQLIEIDQTK